MKIGIVTETYWPDVNGVAMTLNRLTSGLLKKGHTVHLICPGVVNRNESEFPENLHYHAVRGFPIPGYKEARFGLPAKSFIEKLWEQEKPDVIYVATEGPLGWSTVKLATQLHIPVVSGFHTNFHSYSKYYQLGYLSTLIQRYLVSLHEKSLTTVVPTKQQADKVSSMGIKNISIIGRGVDTDLFSPGKRDHSLRASWGVEENDPVLLYVGRLAAEKNLNLAVRTYHSMKKLNSRIKFVFVGNGPLLKQYKKDNPQFIFTGSKTGEELAACYASSDIFLFPSLTETFGNVVLEAMASGLSVIAFDYAAAAMHIKDHQNGFVSTFNHSHKFRQAANFCLSNPELMQKVRVNARQYALTQSWAGIVNQFEALLHQYSSSSILQTNHSEYGEVKYEA